MAKHSLLSKLKRSWYALRKRRSPRSSSGFTLLELLVVTIIAGGIVTGLTYMVIQLTQADLRESSRSETQREMQMALDYISNELRQASYVYTGTCLQGATGSTPGDACAGLVNYIPASLSSNGSVPILAFWRQLPLPQRLRDDCTDRPEQNPVINGEQAPCLNANSYALIVYALVRDSSANDANNIWRGRARIVRYALTEFNNDGSARTQGYVNPGVYSNFDTWPFGPNPDGSGTIVNLQTVMPVPGRPNGTPQVLVDFVDDGRGALAQNPPVPVGTDITVCPNNPATPTADYVVSPPLAVYSTVFPGARSFYACVSVTSGAAGVNQDTILFLRGNANGRPSIFTDNAFLPTLETRVLSRSVLDRGGG